MQRLILTVFVLMVAIGSSPFFSRWYCTSAPAHGAAEQPAAQQPAAATHQVKLNGHTFTLPAGFEIELAARPPLVDRPITADFDEQGRLYVADSSGSNEKLTIQLEKKPHRIVRLEDTKGTGTFDRQTIFADKMMFPEGTLWHAGSLYVSAPPSIWKLTDTDGDGVADVRTEWFKGKTLTGCGNDLHGPYLGPDGWIYWCKGAFAKQEYDRPGKKPFITRASHIFRARPDGTGIEHVMTGGMDNPVDLVFTPGGERIFTTTFFQFPGGGKRDGLIHAVYGGVYGKDWDVNHDHPWTGPSLMPPMTHLGAAAPAGLHRYQSSVFGPEFQDNLFAACFNLQKITRHVLEADGSTFKTRDFDFLVSDNKDFHPTDVIEDADGSLLVIDTGGWYKLCCPTSQLVKPDVLGAIYRVRKAGVPRIDDPRGLKLDWSKLTTRELAKLLGDARPAVRRRAMETLSKADAKISPVQGGTILVFDVDKKEGADKVPTEILAEALRRRIDPNDLKHIVIRPAGEGRVEIILPTAGGFRAQKAEVAWKDLKAKLAAKYGIAPERLTVDRGHPDELADKIHLELLQKTWHKIFSDPKVWQKLIQRSYGTRPGEGEWRGLPRTKVLVDGVEVYRHLRLDAIKPADITNLIEVLQEELRKIDVNVTETDVKNWIKREAWRIMQDKVLEKWQADLAPSRENLYAIRPDSHEQLVGFIYCKGNVMTQAFLNMMAPTVGMDVLDPKEYGSRREINRFIVENYGPSLAEIRKDLRNELEKSGPSQDLTLEEVQRIKDLVSRVGSLEFLVLANNKDDKKAQDRMQALFHAEENKAELAQRAKDGLPPFGPFGADKAPQSFTIVLPGGKSVVSYRWVELGPQQRKHLNLDNAAEFERERSATWAEAKFGRIKQEAIILHDVSGKRPLLEGALFFSRECVNRNLPEEERRAKKVEYFVLARNPEIDPTDPQQKRETPAITGRMLNEALSGQGPGLRPTLFFSFNKDGGKLLGDLTSKNLPSGDKDDPVKRHLAIVLDGQIMSAPSILAKITEKGQITGGFTQKEVDDLVKILRTGTLPAKLKRPPVSETTTESPLDELMKAPGTTAAVRRDVVWTASRIDSPDAWALVRRALNDADETVRQAALHSVSLRRDAQAVPQLLKILKTGTPPNRRAAAEGLGRIGDRSTVSALLEAVGTPVDRFLEHSLIYALIEIGDHEATRTGLKSDNPAIRRAALIALDQMESARLQPAELAAALAAADARLEEAAWWIAGRHPEWGQTLGKFFQARLGAKHLKDGERTDLINQLAKLARSPAIQSVLAERLLDGKASADERRLVLKAMSQARLKETPANWLAGIEQTLAGTDTDLVRETLVMIRSLPQPKKMPAGLAGALTKLAQDDKQSAEIRLYAMAIVPAKLSKTQFALAQKEVKADRPVATRALAAEVLSQASLSKGELLSLVETLPDVGPMELHRLLEAFAQSSDDEVGRRLLAGLEKVPARSALRNDRLKLSLAKFSPDVRKQAEKLLAALDADAGKQQARLEQILADLDKGDKGDVRRGQAVFNHQKNACASCHAIGYLGGNVGPDLTHIGRIRSERDLVEAIVFPNASFVRSYEPVQVTTRAGKVYNGILRRDNAEDVMLVLGANQEVVIPRSDIDEMQPSRVSIMPSGLDQQLTLRDLADLVAFLRACK